MLMRKVMQKVLLSRAAYVFLGMAALLTRQGWVQAQLMAQAPGQEICEDNPERASSIRKTVDVPELGIRVEIPENFRVALMPRGVHEIISESEFELLSCGARGGYVRGRGRYVEEIGIVENPSQLDSLTLIINTIQESIYREGQSVFYTGELFSAIVVNAPSRTGFGNIGAWIQNPSSQEVVFVKIGCDCDVDLTSMFRILSRMSFL
ncbi:MAG: hypothetical protein EA367_15810 [Leptolyngbya sp. DLM2.Bin15]|nr:MAG: hypothetical protein EA367_15810 [Leptolyngbya sp. DLM2.Bin15]